jgi:WD40 repeat protein
MFAHRMSEKSDHKPHIGTWVCLLVATAALFLSVMQAARALQAPVEPGTKPALPPVGRPQLELQLGHIEIVLGVAFSRDGKMLASSSQDGAVKLWEVSTGMLQRTLTGHTGAVWCAAFSPDGRSLATGGSDGNVRLWRAATWELQWVLTGHTGEVRSVAFFPDGQRLVSASMDGTVRVWDPGLGAELRRLSEHRGGVVSLALSPDGMLLATGSSEGELKVWEVATWKARWAQALPAGQGRAVTALTFSPDGKTLASASRSGAPGQPGQLRLWDAQTGQPRWGLTGIEDGAQVVAFSPDGKLLATDTGFNVRLWDAETGALQRELHHGEGVQAVAFSPDGKSLASGGNMGVIAPTVKLWEVQSGALRRALGWSDQVRAVAFLPDGKTLVSGGRDRTVRLWDVQTGALRRILAVHESPVNAVAISPDGRIVASASHYAGVKLGDVATGEQLHEWRGRSGNRASLAFSPDGRMLAAGGENDPGVGCVELWDVRVGASLWTQERAGYVLSVAFSPDGKTIASGSEDKTVRLWDARTGELRRTLTGHTSGVMSVAFSADGATVASMDQGPDMAIRLWDAPTGKMVRTISTEPYSNGLITFSPDGKSLAFVSGEQLRLLDIQTGKVQWGLNGHRHWITAVALSRDGSRIATAGFDTTVRIRDARDGSLLATLVTLPPDRESLVSTDWLTLTPQGYYDRSPGAARFFQWRVGRDRFPGEAYEPLFYRPDLVRKVLARERIVAAPRLQPVTSGRAVPPQVTITQPRDRQTVSGSTLRVEVTVTDDRQVVRVEVRVNGRPVHVKPIRVGGKPIPAAARASRPGSKPIRMGAKAIPLRGKTIAAGARPILVGGKPLPSAHRFLHQLTAEVPLPAGETQVALKAIATDDEALQGWTELRLNRPVAAPPAGDLHVLAVGVSRYQNPRYNLKYAARDAAAFGRLWSRMQGTLYRRVAVTPLIDAEATTGNIRRELFRLLETATNRDSVALFLSGHGVQVSEREFYFAAHDIDPTTPQRVKETALPWTVFQTTLAKVDAKRVFLFLDACHSGSALGDQQASSERLAEALVRRGGVLVFSSSRGGEYSYELDALRQGAFTAAMLEGIGEGKADLPVGGRRDGRITAWELLVYLQTRVPELTEGRQTPSCPLIWDFVGEAFLLARSR